MPPFVALLLAAVLLAAPARGTQLGIDFIDAASTASMQCLHSNNMFMSTRIFMDGGGGQCDGTGGNNLALALEVGVPVVPYIFPNPQTILNGGHNATVQVDMAVYCGALNHVPPTTVYWLDIEVDPCVGGAQCVVGWGPGRGGVAGGLRAGLSCPDVPHPLPRYNPWPDCSTSSDYILEMIATLWGFSDIAGVYTSAYEWQQVTCNEDEFNARLRALALSMPAVGVPDDDLSLRIRNASTLVAGAKSTALWCVRAGVALDCGCTAGCSRRGRPAGTRPGTVNPTGTTSSRLAPGPTRS